MALSYVQDYATNAIVARHRTPEYFMAVSGQLFVLAMYLPVTIMVLRRPNEGPLPVRFELWIARWPAWLRGKANSA